MKTALSKVSQYLCCGKLYLKNFDKKVMPKTPSQELYTRFSKRINSAEGWQRDRKDKAFNISVSVPLSCQNSVSCFSESLNSSCSNKNERQSDYFTNC